MSSPKSTGTQLGQLNGWWAMLAKFAWILNVIIVPWCIWVTTSILTRESGSFTHLERDSIILQVGGNSIAVGQISNRLDRIENKIDRLIERDKKHD